MKFKQFLAVISEPFNYLEHYRIKLKYAEALEDMKLLGEMNQAAQEEIKCLQARSEKLISDMERLKRKLRRVR